MLNQRHTRRARCCSEKSGVEAGLQRVLSPKTGVVKHLGYLYRNAAEPSPDIVSSGITAFHRFSGNKADFAATGTSVLKKQALWSATGESIERYCAALSDFQPCVKGSYEDLSSKGEALLHPDEFTLFADEQYQQTNFPFAKPDCQKQITWLRGERLDTREQILVPAAFVFNQFRPGGDEARLCPDIHPGVASGSSRERALTGAMLEIVERDAMMIHWLNSLPVTGIEEDNDFEQLRRDFNIPQYLQLHLAYLQTDLDVTCIFALLLDKQNGLLGGGCSAGFSARHTAQKAICEAVQILQLSKEIKLGEKSKLAVKKGPFPPAFLDPEARKKLPLTELLYNLGYYLEPSNWGQIQDFVSPSRKVPLGECECGVAPGTEYRSLLDNFLKAGLHPISVDLTTPDVAELGWQVFRVVAPGAVPNTATLYTPAALTRLSSVPEKLGYAPAARLNTKPMPYA